MQIPMTHGAVLVTIPRFSFSEWAAMADYYNLTVQYFSLLIRSAYLQLSAALIKS